MSIRHSNISVFVPHIGCPNMCSFCDQRHITGVTTVPSGEDVVKAVNIARSSKNYDPETTEIAFFGGSFTAIDRDYMMSLLTVAYSFIQSGDVKGIRISTRPDAIDNEVLCLLKAYGVTSIELGAQSMDDEVLRMNNRGHLSDDVVNASHLIKKYGFSLGLQMMTGLYGDSEQKTIKTAQELIKLNPETVRIYPTIVLKDTTLATLYTEGKYKPQTVGEAVKLCTKLLRMFSAEGIKVIRLGLHSIDNEAYVAGPWHPAFSELCFSEIFLQKALEILNEKGDYCLFVAPENLSKMIGQSRANIEKLKSMGYNCKVLPDEAITGDEIRVKRGNI